MFEPQIDIFKKLKNQYQSTKKYYRHLIMLFLIKMGLENYILINMI